MKNMWVATGRLFQRNKGVVFCLPTTIFMAVVCIYPLFRALRLGFFTEVGHNKIFTGFGNYWEVLNDSTFWLALRNTFLYSSSTVLGHVLLALVIASLLNQKIRCAKLWRALNFLPWLLPPVAKGLLWILIFQPESGFLNTSLRQLGLSTLEHNWLGEPKLVLWSLVVVRVWGWLPLYSLLFLAGLQTIPGELYEVGELDGAGKWRLFWNITLPLLMPIILTASLIDAIWTFSAFDVIWVTTQGGPVRASEVLSTYIYKLGFYQFDFYRASAVGGIMASIMSVFVFLYIRRYLRE